MLASQLAQSERCLAGLVCYGQRSRIDASTSSTLGSREFIITVMTMAPLLDVLVDPSVQEWRDDAAQHCPPQIHEF